MWDIEKHEYFMLCDETVSHRSLNVVIIQMNHIRVCMMYVRESDIQCIYIYMFLPVIKNVNLFKG